MIPNKNSLATIIKAFFFNFLLTSSSVAVIILECLDCFLFSYHLRDHMVADCAVWCRDVKFELWGLNTNNLTAQPAEEHIYFLCTITGESHFCVFNMHRGPS